MALTFDEHLPRITKLRHQLHQAAEVSGSEDATAGLIKKFLTKEAKPDSLKTEVGGHGLFATYNGSSEAPHIMLRCELDGLPIEDDIDADYRAKTEGVGHKCGHDGHMAILCGVAKKLAAEPPASAKVSLLFQPAEETGQGAQQILQDDSFQQLQPDYCFALHNLPGFARNELIIRDGVFAAASVGLEVNLSGATSHAAHPEEGRSPAMAMAQLVQSLSTVPQFYSPLDQAAKVTVVSAELGQEAFGTSPGKATVRATLRTYDNEHLERLKKRCVDLAGKLSVTYDIDMKHRWVEEFAATKNDRQAVQTICKAAKKQNIKIHKKNRPFSWSEDFGRFTEKIDGAIFGIGAGKKQPALHSKKYDFPDELISSGVAMFLDIIDEVSAQSSRA